MESLQKPCQTSTTPLPTLYYPFVDRKNWKYWFQLSNGEFFVKDRATLPECIRKVAWCKKAGIPCKAMPRSEGNKLGMEIALNLFYNRITDRNAVRHNSSQ